MSSPLRDLKHISPDARIRLVVGSVGVVIIIVVCIRMVGCLSHTIASSSSPPSLLTAVHVSMRQSLLDSNTGVLQLENRSSSPISNIVLIFRNLDSREDRRFDIRTLQSREQTEIGALEAAWTFVPNETIDISLQDGSYAPVRFLTYRAEGGQIGLRQVALK